MKLKSPENEVSYIGASEAVLRLLELSGRQPAVVSLSVHLGRYQIMAFLFLKREKKKRLVRIVIQN